MLVRSLIKDLVETNDLLMFDFQYMLVIISSLAFVIAGATSPEQLFASERGFPAHEI